MPKQEKKQIEVQPRGPKAKRLKYDGHWIDAVKQGLQTPPPSECEPKPKAPDRSKPKGS